MPGYVEIHGRSLKDSRQREREADLHHIRIHGHEDGTPESPRWVVSHHVSDNDPKPTEFVFEDGHEMLAHIAEHASVPEPEEGPEREILPRSVDNLSGRAAQ